MYCIYGMLIKWCGSRVDYYDMTCTSLGRGGCVYLVCVYMVYVLVGCFSRVIKGVIRVF